MEIYAYVGLEIGTYVSELSEMKDYWYIRMFFGQEVYRKILIRDRLLKIRALLRIYPTCIHHEAVVDPLWHPRAMTENFPKN